MNTAVERERQAFHRVLPSLLAVEGNKGRFALIHQDTVSETYPTFDTALEAGYERFGLKPFLVKEVTENEEPKYFSRNLSPCQ